jgi:hypothetical protein
MQNHLFPSFLQKLKSEAVASWTESSGEHSSTYYAALELAPTVELILQEGTPSGSTFVLERRREYEWVVRKKCARKMYMCR